MNLNHRQTDRERDNVLCRLPCSCRMECVILRCYGNTNYLGNSATGAITQHSFVCVSAVHWYLQAIFHIIITTLRVRLCHMTQTNQSQSCILVTWHRPAKQAITELYSGHVTQTSQSQSCILVTWHKPANQSTANALQNCNEIDHVI